MFHVIPHALAGDFGASEIGLRHDHDKFVAAVTGQEIDFAPALVEQLRDFLVVDRGTVPYRQIAERLAMTEGAVKVAVHRLRKRYGELLLEEVARTVDLPREIEDEMQYLLRAVER